MGWDGAGNFTRARNWQNDEAADIDMLSANFDEEDDNFATGINACLTKNGETKPTADFRPNATRTYALGSTALRWTNAYLSGSVNVQSATAAASTTVSFTDATSARTITVPDATGTLSLLEVAQTVSGAKTHSAALTTSDIFTASGPTKFAKAIGAHYLNNAAFSATAAANALTVTLLGEDAAAPSSTNPVECAFRSTTLTTGTSTVRAATAATTVVVPDGATLGFIASEASYIYVYLIDNAGTIELAVSGDPQTTAGLVSTTAIGTGSDTKATLYSTTARTNVACRYLGKILLTTGATPGQWSTPTSLHGVTDEPPMWSVGYGQTWQTVTGSRSVSTTYTNSTGRPIVVSIIGHMENTKLPLNLIIGGVTIQTVDNQNSPNACYMCMSGIVPPGATYSVTGGGLTFWHELR